MENGAFAFLFFLIFFPFIHWTRKTHIGKRKEKLKKKKEQLRDSWRGGFVFGHEFHLFSMYLWFLRFDAQVSIVLAEWMNNQFWFGFALGNICYTEQILCSTELSRRWNLHYKTASRQSYLYKHMCLEEHMPIHTQIHMAISTWMHWEWFLNINIWIFAHSYKPTCLSTCVK